MFGLLSKKKTAYLAKIAGKGEITVQPGDNLLKAALDQGYAWPHNCRVGSCGSCRCKLISGKIKPLNDFSYVLNREELDDGMILACQTSLRSDVEIEVALEEAPAGLVPAKTVSGAIEGCRHLTHDIIALRIKLDEAMPTYLAGQYADLIVPDAMDKPRSYSFASAPGQLPSDHIDFYIRRVPGGVFTEWLHAKDRRGAALTVTGPNGSFWLRESMAPMICVAGGSGLAPIKALLEQLGSQKFNRQVVFLFGARTQKDLYCLSEMADIKTRSGGHFDFVPVLSMEPEDSGWSGLRGLVADFIPKQTIDLRKAHAYLCGPPPMVDAAISKLTEAGVAENRIYYDKFFDASTMPGGR